MDELAVALKIEPAAFRLKNATDPRLRAVIEAAMERFGWGKRTGKVTGTQDFLLALRIFSVSLKGVHSAGCPVFSYPQIWRIKSSTYVAVCRNYLQKVLISLLLPAKGDGNTPHFSWLNMSNCPYSEETIMFPNPNPNQDPMQAPPLPPPDTEHPEAETKIPDATEEPALRSVVAVPTGEEVGEDLTFEHFDNRTIENDDLRDAGAVAFMSGRELLAITADLDANRKEATERAETIVARRKAVIDARLTANTEKLKVLKEQLFKAEQLREELTTEHRTAMQGLDSAVGEALALRLTAAHRLAQWGAEEADAEGEADDVTEPAKPGARPIPLLDETSTHLPPTYTDVRIATLWRRILRARSEWDSSRKLTLALERCAISRPMTRFLLASGYLVIGAAGGALGNLLQESDIGNHSLEQLLSGIQMRLGFAGANGTGPWWPSSGPLVSLAFSALLILAIVGAILGTLKLISLASKALRLDSPELTPEDGNFHEHEAEEPSMLSKRFYRSVLEGQRRILTVVPGIALALFGLCLFLAVAPTFAGSAVSVTKSSIGFVIAVAFAAAAQVLFRLTIYPTIRERLTGPIALSVLPAKVWLVYVAAVFLLTGAMAFGPAIERSFETSTVLNPSAAKGSSTSNAQASSANTPDVRPVAPSSPERPRWALHTVWFLTASTLLIACMTLAFGSSFAGSFREESRIRKILFDMEESLAKTMPGWQRNRTRADHRAQEHRAATRPVGVTYGTDWLERDAIDLFMERCVTSAAFDQDGIKELIRQHALCVAAVRRLGHARSALEQTNSRVDQIAGFIGSTEKSTRTYENNLLRIQQQADGICLLLLTKHQDRVRMLSEGFAAARRAYTPEEAAPKSFHAVAGGKS